MLTIKLEKPNTHVFFKELFLRESACVFVNKNV